MAGKANIICKYIICIFFQFWSWLLWFFFLCYFQKLQLLVVKKYEIIFAVLYFYLYKLEKYISDFKNLISN